MKKFDLRAKQIHLSAVRAQVRIIDGCCSLNNAQLLFYLSFIDPVGKIVGIVYYHGKEYVTIEEGRPAFNQIFISLHEQLTASMI